jgi:hypothetical protein
VNAPAVWLSAERPYRACDLCSHGLTLGSHRFCSLGDRGRPLPVPDARAPGGHCGPDAERLDFPGLHVPPPGAHHHAAR